MLRVGGDLDGVLQSLLEGPDLGPLLDEAARPAVRQGTADEIFLGADPS